MKFKNIFKILILVIFVVVLYGCSNKTKTFTLAQDGNFLIYHGKEVTNETKFSAGTSLVAKVKEDSIPANQMVDKVYINADSVPSDYQYIIVMDKNINLKVLFKEVPTGSSRISLLGEPVTISGGHSDYVFQNGEKVVVTAPEHFAFNYIYIDDVKEYVNAKTYEFVVTKPIKIRVDKEGLMKTHTTISLQYPSNFPVTISNPSSDGYYEINSTITFLAPDNHSFTSQIKVEEDVYNLTGDRFTVTVSDNMQVIFTTSNFLMNTFEVSLETEGLVFENPKQELYAHGSVVKIKTESNKGLDIIDTLTINGKKVVVNQVRYDLTITDDTTVFATFKLYDGPYETVEISTKDKVELKAGEKFYSPSKFVDLVPAGEKEYLVFQKDGTFLVRIDNSTSTHYYKYIVKYEVEEIKIYQNGFGFIDRNEVISVGVENDFSLQLEVKASIINRGNVNEFETINFLLRTNQIGNLDYTVEENGLDVTKLYLEPGDIKFNEDAIGKRFDLIISTSDQKIKIIQPIYVIEGFNINSVEDLKQVTNVAILQADIELEEATSFNNINEMIGNYHVINFDVEADNLISISDRSFQLSNVILKASPKMDLENNILINPNQTMILATNSDVTLDGVIIENTKFGLHSINSIVNIERSKFQNIQESNLVLVQKGEEKADILEEEPKELLLSSTKIINSVLSKTNNASILIVDLDTTENKDPELTLESNTYKNIKIDPEIDELILKKLEDYDPNLVSRDPLWYNLVFIIDGGLIYKNYFDELVVVNKTPNAIIN